MGLSKKEIYNAALYKVSRRAVSAVDDGSYEANTCNNLFPKALNETLYDHVWNSARARVKLVALTEAPAFGYDYAYQLPNDFIRLIQAYRSERLEDFNFRWEIQGRTILTNSDAVYLKYVALPSSTEQLNPAITTCLVHRLAMEIAMPFQLDRAEVKDLGQEYTQLILPHAKAIDSMENRSLDYEENPWIQGMNGLGPVNRGGVQ